MPEAPHLSDDILIFLLGIVLPFVSGVKSTESFENIHFTPSLRRRFYLMNSGLLWIAAILVTAYWWYMGRNLSTMGMALPSGKNQALTWGLSALLIALYILDLVYSFRNEEARKETAMEQESNTPFLPDSFREFPAYIWLCISAGSCEEVLYRGFMVTYFMPMGFEKDKFPFMALIAPAILFSLAHFYQGWHAVMKIFILSILLGAIYISSGSLIMGMVLHFAIDLTGGILAVKLRSSRI